MSPRKDGASAFMTSAAREVLTPREVRDVEKMCGLSYYVRRAAARPCPVARGAVACGSHASCSDLWTRGPVARCIDPTSVLLGCGR